MSNGIIKLMSIVTGTSLNEVGIGIPTTKDHLRQMKRKMKPKDLNKQFIHVRTKSEATAGGEDPTHSTSVKVYLDIDFDIGIPTKAGDKFKKLNIFEKSCSDFNVVKVVKSIIYDNQALLLAYWFHDNKDDKIGKELIQLLVERIISKDYAKNSVTKPMSAIELESSKENLVNEIRERLQDDTIELSFGK